MAPVPRAQPPCDHGPITSMFDHAGVLLLDRVVDAQRPERVFGVEPAADVQDGAACTPSMYFHSERFFQNSS